MNKEKYLKKSLEVFKKEGLQISIDDLAEKIGVTKKTLYNHFNSKEELLNECVFSFASEIKERIKVMYSPEINAIEGIRRGMDEMKAIFCNICNAFIEGLKKIYPEIGISGHKAGFSIYVDSVKKNIEKGIKEGLYMPETDINLISNYYSYSSFSFFHKMVITSNEFSCGDFFNTIVEYHLSAILTDKGRNYINKTNNRQNEKD